MRNRIPIAAAIAGLLFLTSVAAPAARADEEGASGPWSFELTPYIWLPEVQGPIKVRDQTVNLDVGFGDIFDLLGFD